MFGASSYERFDANFGPNAMFETKFDCISCLLPSISCLRGRLCLGPSPQPHDGEASTKQ